MKSIEGTKVVISLNLYNHPHRALTPKISVTALFSSIVPLSILKDMAEHNLLGQEGEEQAAKWLIQQGYQILHRNWKYSYYEIDIIARKKYKLHFIEVKARRTERYGYPEDSVTRKKFRRLQKAADQYLFLNPGNKWIQFDILSIILQKGKEPKYFLIEDMA